METTSGAAFWGGAGQERDRLGPRRGHALRAVRGEWVRDKSAVRELAWNCESACRDVALAVGPGRERDGLASAAAAPPCQDAEEPRDALRVGPPRLAGFEFSEVGWALERRARQALPELQRAAAPVAEEPQAKAGAAPKESGRGAEPEPAGGQAGPEWEWF